MTAGTAGAFRTLAFGDLDGGLWGAAWVGAESFVAIGTLGPGGSGGGPVDAAFLGSRVDEDWSVSGDGLELTVSGHREPTHSPQLEGFDQLCHVRGRLLIEGAEQTVNALGRRGLRSGIDFGRLDSIRDVCAWFPPDDGIAVTALRPRRAAGHEGDVVVASLFEPSGALDVADPRLSTTYGADGSPARAGVELWLDLGDGTEEQYPRRAAGEGLGAVVTAAPDGPSVQARVFRWHSRGHDGTGVYMLARLG